MNYRQVRESREWFDALRRSWAAITGPIAVLLVEDDEHDARLIRNAIECGRVTVTVVDDGKRALDELKGGQFDLCLLDLKLNDLAGPEILRWAKTNNVKTPFVVLTGMQDGSPLIKAALDAGAECIFQKPLSPENVKMIFGGL